MEIMSIVSVRRAHVPNGKTEMQATGMLRSVSPSEYLRLRRKAAGLSIADAASLIAQGSRAIDAQEAAALIRLLETPGVRARRLDPIWVIAVAYPVDPDVYQQLARGDADRHPTLCRVCGCSKYDNPGDWYAPTLCTGCAQTRGKQ